MAVDLLPFAVSKGDIMLVLPGQLHSIQQVSDHSMEYENIIFELSMLMGHDISFGDCKRKKVYRDLSPSFFYINNFHRIVPVRGHQGKIQRNAAQVYIKGSMIAIYSTILSNLQKRTSIL